MMKNYVYLMIHVPNAEVEYIDERSFAEETDVGNLRVHPDQACVLFLHQ